jgi:hypothetical protein
MKNQGLLKTLNECEYPAEFLVARLLGKKGALSSNWDSLVASSNVMESLQNTPFYPYLKRYAAPGIWRFLRNEHQWVYKRMNNKLRNHFESYFAYQEISTLIVCLRYLSGKEIDRVLQALHNSLLHDDIQNILTSNLDFAAKLQALEYYFRSYSGFLKGLRERYEKKDIAALEVFVRDCFFTSILSQKQPSLLKKFFHHLVDFHNCISLAKALRWQIEAEPALIDGGTVPLERFKAAYFRKNLYPVLKLLRLQDTDAAASSIQLLETALLKHISGKLKNWSLQRTEVGDILFYLWEQYRYSRNISMILYTMFLDDELVLGRIVA